MYDLCYTESWQMAVFCKEVELIMRNYVTKGVTPSSPYCIMMNEGVSVSLHCEVLASLFVPAHLCTKKSV